MKKNKTLIIVLIITYFLISIYFVFIKKDNTIYLGSSTKIKIKNNNIIMTKENKQISMQKAKVYFDGEFIDGYIRSIYEDYNNSNSFQVLDNNFNLLNSNEGLIAYTGNKKIEIANVQKVTTIKEEEKTKLKSIADENGIEGTLSNFIKIEYNLDSDKEKEIIYSYKLSNIEKDTTITIIKDKEDYEIIDIESGRPESPGLKQSYFYKLIDFNNDNTYEIVLFQSNGDDSDGEYKIYSYTNGTVINIK